MDPLIDTQINYEPFVYPVQFMDYKSETFEIKSFIESFNNLYSAGAGGEFNYADSQILFHKTFDLVENLSNKYTLNYQTKRERLKSKLNEHVFLGKKMVGNGKPVFIIAEAGVNHNGDIIIAKKLMLKF